MVLGHAPDSATPSRFLPGPALGPAPAPSASRLFERKFGTLALPLSSQKTYGLRICSAAELRTHFLCTSLLYPPDIPEGEGSLSSSAESEGLGTRAPREKGSRCIYPRSQVSVSKSGTGGPISYFEFPARTANQPECTGKCDGKNRIWISILNTDNVEFLFFFFPPK